MEKQLTLDEVKQRYLESLDSLIRGELYIDKQKNSGIDIETHPYCMPLINKKMRDCEIYEYTLIENGINIEELLNKWEEESKIANSTEYKEFTKRILDKFNEQRLQSI